MGEKQGHRGNVHPVMLNASLEIGIVKVQAKLECGKSAAILYVLNEGLYQMGHITPEEHELLASRYSRKLVDVIKEKNEDSHVPVLTIEQRKQHTHMTKFLEQKDKQFKGMIEQWVLHPDANWRSRAVNDAKKFEDELESARLLVEKAESDERADRRALIHENLESLKNCDRGRCHD